MSSKLFFRKRVGGMPDGAENYLCYYVERDRIWGDYEMWCRDYGMPQATKEEFLGSLKDAHPEIDLVNRCGEWRIYNIEYQPQGIACSTAPIVPASE